MVRSFTGNWFHRSGPTRRRPRGGVFLALLTLLTSVIGLVAGATAASAAPGAPFTCTTPTIFLSQGNPTQLQYSQYGAGSVTFTNLGTPYAGSYNALGFDPLNGYLYAQQAGTNGPGVNFSLLQIDSTGAVTPLGAVTGLPDGNLDGAFDSAGNLWVTAGDDSSSKAYEINVTTSPPQVIATLNLSQKFAPDDFTFADGYLWGMDGFYTAKIKIYRLNMSTGQVDTFNAPASIVSGTGVFGAAWTFGNGNLGFSNNSNGDVYQISVANPSAATPTFAVVSHYSGPSSSTNDGAACTAIPTDLGIVKTGPATVSPGGTVTWTLSVTNNGPGDSSGFAVSDDVPAGVTNVASSTPGCSVTGNTVLCSEGALPHGASETPTITLTGNAPPSTGTCFTNTATVTANEVDPNAANNSSSVQTCTSPASPAVSLVKSASVSSYSSAGTPVTYSYQVTNSGNTTLGSVAVTDPMPGLSAVTCPSSVLAPGASETCTATYTTTQADVDAGAITNTGTATGTPPTGPAVTASSSVTIPAIQAPAISLAKSANVSSYSAAGTPVTYSYQVTNSGNATLSSVAVTDPMPGLSPVTCPDSSLAPGASETCTATYTTTQADVDAGAITNTGTATGTPPTGPAVTASSSVTIPATLSPAISLAKSANVSSYSSAGTPITYSYQVTNTGNVTLGAVGVTDPMPGLSAVSCPNGSLAPSASETCTATYTTTQSDVDAGSLSNTGTATGTPPTGPAVTATSSLTIPATQAPSIAVVKSSTTPNYSAPGAPISYNFVITNTGNVTLAGIEITDTMTAPADQPDLSAVVCPTGTLAPGASDTCTATYTTTQADVDNGSVNNTATVSGTPPGSQPPVTSGPSGVTVPAVEAPSITLLKSSTTSSYSAAGTPVTYSYQVSNTGNVTLNPVTVTDPMPGLSAITCPNSSLVPGASETCTATYTTTQADVDAGALSNTGTATGTPPSGPKVTATSSVTIPASQTPAITVKKSSTTSSYSAAGTPITYSYKVSNTGNVTLTSVGVTDPMTGLSAITCPSSSLAPGASETCTATYTTTQADVDAGALSNTGTATGTPPSGPNVTASSSVTIPAAQSPAITVKKSSTTSSYSAAGTPITYSYKVTNTGNVTLSSVGVTDPMTGLSAITCPSSSLAPGASETCTATYTTTQADVDAGALTNTGTATGTPPSGPNVTATSSLTIPASQAPAITVKKSSTTTSYSAAGTPVIYSYKVSNTGNVTLNPVTVTDPMTGLSAITCPNSSLTPGASETCTATYTTTQADVDAGTLTNTGTATGTPPSGPNVTATSSLTIPASQAPAITVKKSSTTSSYSAAGTPIAYSYKVSNTGNVTLNPVTVTDPMTGLSAITCPNSSLTPGASETCTATYTTTQADVDAGTLTNTGTATGTPPSGPNVTATSSLTIPAAQAPAITVKKSSTTSSYSAAGTPIAYSYKVTNTGNVTLTSVGVTDPMTGLSAITCPNSSLTPGASETCTATYTTTQADVDAGALTNTGTATGTSPAGTKVTATSSLTIPATQTPGVSLLKSASASSFSAAGTPVTYSYKVTNTGNVTLTSVGVTDPMTGLSAITCPSTTLAPGASETCTATYTTTQADVDRGAITNTGTATGTSPAGTKVTATSSVTVPGPTASPKITLVKSANITSFSGAGTPVTYSYKVTNSGNVTLTSVGVTDPMAGLSAITCPSSSLAPGASETCTATYTTTQADVDRGAITNTGTATGTSPTGTKVTATSSVTVPGPTASPKITLVKSANISSFSGAGTAVTYSYKVTNTGNVTLTSVGVTDPMTGLSAITCPSTTLAPGASETCTATYTTTQADVDRGAITNTGTATGTSPTGTKVTATSSVTVPGPTASPKITLVKSANISSFSGAGTAVTYSYAVTNTGNVTLNPVTVTDPMTGLSAISCPATKLAPGATETCTATYTTTQTDVSKGAITNTATVTGTSPTGTKVTATSSVTIKGTCPTTTKLTLAKTSVSYGSETPEVFTATVSSNMGTPTGTVAVTSSAGTLCTITLSSGKGTCSLTATQLPVGSYTNVMAVYAGSGLFPGSSSAATSSGVEEAEHGQDPAVVGLGDGQVELGEDVGHVLLDRSLGDDRGRWRWPRWSVPRP
jgi:uncharacterized repeat protein (TIGR01451 family)